MKRYHYVVLVALLSLIANAGRSFGADPLEDLVQCVHSEATKEILLKVKTEDGFKKSGRDLFTPATPIKVFGFVVAYVGNRDILRGK